MNKVGVVSWEFLQKAALLYFTLPVLVFICFWFNIPWNLLFIALTIWAVYKIFSDKKGLLPDESVYRKTSLWSLGVFALVFAFVLGVGGWMPQNEDYEKANCFFTGLKALHWPWGCRFADGQTITLVYYYGYYLIPSLLGACLGSWAMSAAALLEAALGLWLALLAFGKYFKLPAWTLPLFLGFSGLCFLGALITNGHIVPIKYWGEWSWPFVNMSMVSTFFLSPYHLITPLMLLPLVLRALDDGRSDRALLWLSLGLYWSPLTTFGIGALALIELLRSKRLFQLRNVATVLGLVMPAITFFSIRLYPDKFLFLGQYGWIASKYPLFIILEAGIWWCFIRRSFWKDSRLWLAIAFFAILPFIAMGQWLDFLFRVGVPLQIFVYGLVARSVLESPKALRVVPFLLVYLAGAAMPVAVILGQFCNHTSPPLSGHCYQEYRNFLPRVDAGTKEYLGDKKANVLADILLKDPVDPMTMKETLAAAKVYRVLDNTQFDTQDQPLLDIRESRKIFYTNLESRRNVEISFYAKNITGTTLQMAVVLSKDSNVREFWRFYSAYECLDGRFIHSAAIDEPDRVAHFDVPPGGARVLISSTFDAGVTELLFAANPPSKELYGSILCQMQSLVLRLPGGVLRDGITVRVIPAGHI